MWWRRAEMQVNRGVHNIIRFTKIKSYWDRFACLQEFFLINLQGCNHGLIHWFWVIFVMILFSQKCKFGPTKPTTFDETLM